MQIERREEKKTLFVTFLWELDRRRLPRLRPWSVYRERFDSLARESKESGADLLVFTDDEHAITSALRWGVTYVKVSRDSFFEWQRLEQVMKAIARKLPFSNPELSCTEYVCLQNCKFEAMERALSLWPHDTACWIDAGLRKEALRPLRTRWRGTGLRLALYQDLLRPEWFVTETPGSSVMGTAWGGDRDSLVWLSRCTRDIQSELLERGRCANDQQLLTLVAQRHADRVVLFPLYRMDFWLLGGGRWSQILDVLDDEKRQQPERGLHDVVLLCLIAVLICLAIRKL